MILIDTLRPQHRRWLLRLRKWLANREHMRRAREARTLCCVGVDLPLEAGACGRMVHAESQRCIHCARRRWWLLNHALNDVELAITAILEDDTGGGREPRRHPRAPPRRRPDPRRAHRPRRSLPSWVRTLSRTPARTCPAARHGARLPQPSIPTSR